MKYTFIINQVGIVKAGLHTKTDPVDWMLIDYLKDWYFSGYAKKIVVTDPELGEHTEYVWVNYNHLIANIPMLNFDKDAVSYRFKKLRKLGLIKTHQAKDNTLYFILTQECISVYFYKEEETDNKKEDLQAQGGLFMSKKPCVENLIAENLNTENQTT